MLSVPSCLCATKVISKVPFCHYDEETNSYTCLSQNLMVATLLGRYFTV